MANHLYMVQYGVDNSHMCEFKEFNLYRDAKEFYHNLNEIKHKAAVCYKLSFSFNGFEWIASDKEAKLYRFTPGTDNTEHLNRMVIFVKP